MNQFSLGNARTDFWFLEASDLKLFFNERKGQESVMRRVVFVVTINGSKPNFEGKEEIDKSMSFSGEPFPFPYFTSAFLWTWIHKQSEIIIHEEIALKH